MTIDLEKWLSFQLQFGIPEGGFKSLNAQVSPPSPRRTFPVSGIGVGAQIAIFLRAPWVFPMSTQA